MFNERDLTIVLRARDEASKVIQKASGTVRDLEKDFKVVGAAMAGVGAATAGLATHFVRQAGAFEQYQVALGTILGDADKAEQHFQVLKDFARTTPFNFEEVVKNNNLLLAMGANVEDVIDEMEMLGNVAAGLSIPIERVALNFGQVRTQGKLTGRELRDFAISGIPIYEALADVLGVAKDEVADLVSEGAVGFEEVQMAFQNMTAEGGKFHNLMQEQSKTTLGQWSNFQDTLQQTAAVIGETLLPAVNDLLQQAIPIIERIGKWTQEHQGLTKVLVASGIALGVIGTAMLALFPIMATLSSTIAVVSAAFSAGTAIIGGTVAILGGPLTLAIAAVVAAAAGLAIAWEKNWGDIQGKTKWAADRIMIDSNQIEGSITAVGNVFNAWKWEVSRTAESIKNYFSNMASSISSSLRSIKFPRISVGEGSVSVGGREITYPKLDVDWYEKGGFVPRTGLAMLHAGEFVLSKDMLSGRQPAPATVTTTNNTPINIGPVYVQDQTDIDGLAHRLGFMLKTGGRY